ncbi:MAG: hypothetical protein ACLP59_14655 [Bryobacteraceae bacterium]
MPTIVIGSGGCPSTCSDVGTDCADTLVQLPKEPVQSRVDELASAENGHCVAAKSKLTLLAAVSVPQFSDKGGASALVSQ